MKFLKFLLDFLLIGTSIEGEDDSKIQGGYVVDIKRFPFLGSLRFRKYPHGVGCSATLVNPITALTAGHCVSKGEDVPQLRSLSEYGLYLIMGVTDWKDKENPWYQQRDIIKLFLHSKAQYKTIWRASMIPTLYDLGAVKLDKAMITSPTVQLAVFPEGINQSELFEEIMGRNGRCEIAGWGYTRVNNININDTGDPPLMLNSAKFNIISKEDCCTTYAKRRNFRYCMERLGEPVSGMFCDERYKMNTSVNTGDSGSPIICPYKGKCYVVGIHSGSERDYDPPGTRLVHIKNPGYFLLPSVVIPYAKEVIIASPVFISSGGGKTDCFDSSALIKILHLVRFSTLLILSSRK